MLVHFADRVGRRLEKAEQFLSDVGLHLLSADHVDRVGRFARLLNVGLLEASRIARELQEQLGDGIEQQLVGEDPRRAIES